MRRAGRRKDPFAPDEPDFEMDNETGHRRPAFERDNTLLYPFYGGSAAPVSTGSKDKQTQVELGPDTLEALEEFASSRILPGFPADTSRLLVRQRLRHQPEKEEEEQVLATRVSTPSVSEGEPESAPESPPDIPAVPKAVLTEEG